MKCCDVPVRQTCVQRITPSKASSSSGHIERTTEVNIEEKKRTPQPPLSTSCLAGILLSHFIFKTTSQGR